MVQTMLIEKHFLENNTLKNTIIKTDLSFTLMCTNFGPPIKLFRHHAFSFLGTRDTPFSKPWFFAESSFRNTVRCDRTQN
jgi:hypothetical protein